MYTRKFKLLFIQFVFGLAAVFFGTRTVVQPNEFGLLMTLVTCFLSLAAYYMSRRDRGGGKKVGSLIDIGQGEADNTSIQEAQD